MKIAGADRSICSQKAQADFHIFFSAFLYGYRKYFALFSAFFKDLGPDVQISGF